MATAQDRPPSGSPFSGLFRGSPKDQPHTLDVRGSVFTAWDDNLLAQVPGAGDSINLDPRSLKQGVANGFQGSLTYGFHRNGTRSQFSLGGDASVHEFAGGLDNGVLWFHSYNLSTNLRTSITNKTSVLFGAGGSYAPYYQYAPFLKSTMGEESPVGSDYGFAVNSVFVRSTFAVASVEHRLSKKSSISAGVDWVQNVIDGSGGQSVDTRSARMAFTHNLTRKLGFRL